MVKFGWGKLRGVGRAKYLLIPMEVFKDEAFPFIEGESLLVKIEKGGLKIERE